MYQLDPMSLGKLIRPLEEHFRSAFLLWDAYILIDRDKLHCWAWLYNVMQRRLSSLPLAWLYLWFLCVWVALQYVVALWHGSPPVCYWGGALSLWPSANICIIVRQEINIKQRIWVEWTGVKLYFHITTMFGTSGTCCMNFACIQYAKNKIWIKLSCSFYEI